MPMYCKCNVASRVKPFVKWVGGKSQLLGEISESLPHDFDWPSATYVEPFVGGGAVLFWMLSHLPRLGRVVINDANGRLINVYRAVRDCPDVLIGELRLLSAEYLPLSHEGRTAMFLQCRQEFNGLPAEGVRPAALFIFLNRTCFNGLYRENSLGKFNAPHGRYSHPLICDEATIMADSEVLQGVEMFCGDFASASAYAGPSSLFYLDPPYKPLSRTSSFTSYTASSFDDMEQLRLRSFLDGLSSSGSRFILSNSDVRGSDPGNDFFDRLYSGLNVRRVLASRNINRDGSGRGKLSELLVTNF